MVDFGDAASLADFEAVWPMKKMPVLRDEARGCTIAEATVVIEYLDLHHPGGTRLLPTDGDRAWQTRMWDRVLDHYIHYPLQKIVGDELRPAGTSDAYGVDEAKARIRSAYALVERHLDGKSWMMGDDFTLADCAAAPALFYGNLVVPIDGAHENLRNYLDRLFGRASYARVLREAEPYFSMVPGAQKPRLPDRVRG